MFRVYSLRIRNTAAQNEMQFTANWVYYTSITQLLSHRELRHHFEAQTQSSVSKCVKVVTACDRTASTQHGCFQQQPESPLIHNDLEVPWRQRKHLNREEKYDSVRRDSVPGSRLQGCQWVMLCHSHKRLPSSAKSQRAAFPSLSNRK